MSKWINGPLLQYSMNTIYRESSVTAIFERKRKREREKEGFPHHAILPYYTTSR